MRIICTRVGWLILEKNVPLTYLSKASESAQCKKYLESLQNCECLYNQSKIFKNLAKMTDAILHEGNVLFCEI